MTEADPYDLPAQEAADALEAEAARHKRIVEESDFKFIMGNKMGRRFMWRLLSITGIYRNPFQAERGGTDFRCGEQNIGQQLIAEIHNLCPERYIEMIKEQQANERSTSK